MTEPTTTVDLAVTVAHTRGRGPNGPGHLRAFVTWSPGLTPVQRIQLCRTAQAALSREQDQAMAEVTA